MPIKLLLSAALFFCFLFSISSIQAQTAVLPRLIAYTHTNYDGANYEPTDSGSLVYSNGRVYNNKTSRFEFDTNQIYIYQTPYSEYGHTVKEIEKYDDVNNLTVDRTQRLRLSDSSWIDSVQFLFTYDINNSLLTKTRMNWDATAGTWLNIDRYVYTYDGANNILSVLYQVWGAINGWQNNTIHNYTYDSHNNQLSDLYQLYNVAGAVWINNVNTQNIYNTSNEEISSHVQSWVTTTSSWKDSLQNTYSYDASTKNLVEETHHNYVLPVFMYDSNYVYTYDSYNRVASVAQQLWYSTPMWINSVLYTYTYDASGNKTGSLRQLWKELLPASTSFAYINDDSVNYTYNSYHQLTSLLSTTWNAPSGIWEPGASDHYHRYYYVLPTSVNNVNNLNATLNIYPSPASSILNIDIETSKTENAVIMIFDMSGKLCMQWQCSVDNRYHHSIPVNELRQGEYIMCIRNEEGQISKTFSVVH